MQRKIISCFVLLLSTQLLFSQEYFFRNYSVADGMPQSSAYCLMQDSRGFIWIGTPGAGASVFDGKDFITYNKGAGLSGNIVRSIFEDSRGNIWVGTDNGVSWFDGYSIQSIGADEGLKCSFAMRFAESRHGIVWVATNDGGLFGIDIVDSVRVRNFDQNDGLVTNFIYDIHIDEKDRIWLAMIGGLNIIEFENEECNSILNVRTPMINSNFVTAIEKGDDGSFFIGTYSEGLSRIVEDTLSGKFRVDYPFDNDLLSDIRVWDILLKNDGKLLVSTDKKGIICFKDLKIDSRFDTDNGLLSNQVLDLIEDNEGNIWHATMGQGISMYDDKKIIQYGVADGIDGKEVNGILFLNNRLFIASNEGVTSFEIIDDKIEPVAHYNSENGLIDNVANGLIKFDSELWVSTNSGISIIGNGRVRDFPLNSELSRLSESSDLKINCLLKDSDNNIWIGTDNGYNKVVGNSVYYLNEVEGFINNEVQTIIEDSDGRIWMGTLGGLVMLKDDIYTDFNEADGLSELRVHSLAEDINGNIWIGTFGGGIFKFDISKESNPIEMVAGKGTLSSNNIYSLLFIDNSTIVTGTDLGFDLIVLNNDQDIIATTQYNMYDGYSKGENNLNSVAINRTGNVWFGTSDGLVRFDPGYDTDSDLNPLTVITDVRLFFEKVDWESMGFDVQKWFNLPEELVLNHRENHLTFDFTGFCFHDPMDLQFSYFLEGQSKDWSPYDKSNETVFSGLSPGSYVYKVKARNEYGAESEVKEFGFIIKPPVWSTTWFIVVVSFIALALIVLVIKLRERSLVKEKIKLESIVKTRTREVVEQKDEIVKHRDIVVSQKNEITSSIEYAERIQVAVLPDKRILEKAFPDFFILFRPKDIVSGDFYWMSQKGDYTVFSACDCTGHGVPGAFMSLLGVSFLNKIVNESGEVQPAKILGCLRENIISSLKQEGLNDSSKDGMDIALCSIPKNRNKLYFAGANNPVYIVRKNSSEYELIEIKGDRMPVGFHPKIKDFTQHEINLVEGDSIYMFSDGYVDQFGGEQRKKFMSKRFKQVLLDNQDKSMKDQEKLLNKVLEDWIDSGSTEQEIIEQIDDIIVMGIKI